MSKEDEFCPVCGKPKRGVKSYGEALEPGTILNGKILIGNILDFALVVVSQLEKVESD